MAGGDQTKGDEQLPPPGELIEGEHYYFNNKGLFVFTEKYLHLRGYCCGNGCQHCPYGVKKG